MRFSSAKAGARVLLQALQVGANLPRLAAIFLLLLVGARLLGALVEVQRLLVEPAHAVDRLVHAVDQPLALGVGEAERADHLRDGDLLASQLPAHLAVQPGILALRRIGELLGQLDRLLVVLVQLVDAAGDVLQPVQSAPLR